MVNVTLPYHLQTLGRCGAELQLEVAAPATTRALLTALEASYPGLQGAILDPASGRRRPLLRFFACRQDLSLQSLDTPLPAAVAEGREPFMIVGAIAGG